MEFKNVWHLKYVPLDLMYFISDPQLSYPQNGTINTDFMEQLEVLRQELFLKPWHSIDAHYP